MNKKLMSMFIIGLLSINMVACGNDFDSTEYLDEQGKQAIKNSENKEYKQITELNNDYKDEYISIVGKVNSIILKDKQAIPIYKICLDAEENNTPFPIYVYIPANMVDVKFKEDDTVTIYGVFRGLDKGEVNTWHINGYFIEI